MNSNASLCPYALPRRTDGPATKCSCPLNSRPELRETSGGLDGWPKCRRVRSLASWPSLCDLVRISCGRSWDRCLTCWLVWRWWSCGKSCADFRKSGCFQCFPSLCILLDHTRAEGQSARQWLHPSSPWDLLAQAMTELSHAFCCAFFLVVHCTRASPERRNFIHCVLCEPVEMEDTPEDKSRCLSLYLLKCGCKLRLKVEISSPNLAPSAMESQFTSSTPWIVRQGDAAECFLLPLFPSASFQLSCRFGGCFSLVSFCLQLCSLDKCLPFVVASLLVPLLSVLVSFGRVRGFWFLSCLPNPLIACLLLVAWLWAGDLGFYATYVLFLP